MDAFPQLKRCFARQWAGLTEGERTILERHRESHAYFRADEKMAERGLPVWTAEVGGNSWLPLISAKNG